MADEYMDDMSSSEEGELRDNDEPQKQLAQRPSTSSNVMVKLERNKQQETSRFSNRVLAEIGIGGGNGVRVKQESNDYEVETTTPPPTPNAEAAGFVPPDVLEVVKKAVISGSDEYTHTVFYRTDHQEDDLDLSRAPRVKPAKQFLFTPDEFQIEAFKCIGNDRSVFVNAHTSSGKTLIAIYAVAHALNHKKRAIYTTPIKALSNQKYRELSKEFPSTGLMTGDVCINPDADVLVMTTEILRNKLYRQDREMIKDLEWVIFDEIHYMQDPERGVVWEESIIMLPTVKFLFLSATILNGGEFAQWIAYTRKEPCHLVTTLIRPVPLVHYIHTPNCDKLLKIVLNNEFNERNYAYTMGFLTQSSYPDDVELELCKNRDLNPAIDHDNLRDVIRTLWERNGLPILVFSFSRYECEMCAVQIMQMDFNSDEEKHEIRLLFNMAIDELAEGEKNLEQLSQFLPLFLRGIAVHHSGLFPIVKEIIEHLYERALIKVLVATETFAMGVNMPARCVIFTSARKFDGKCTRWLTNGEYLQMSGRAGRRDIKKGTDRGIVVLMMAEYMEMAQAKAMMMGPGDRLESKYHLSYSMILNQIRIEPDAMTSIPKNMLKNTFLQWQQTSSIHRLRGVMNAKKDNWEKTFVQWEDQLALIRRKMDRIEQLDKQIKTIVLTPFYVVPFLRPGRLLKMKCFDKDFDWGVLIDWRKIPCPVPNSNEMIYVLEVAVMVPPDCVRNPNLEMIRPPGPGERAILDIIPFTFECIRAISTMRLKVPMDLTKSEGLEALALYLMKTKERFIDEIPELHPDKDFHIWDENVHRWLSEKEELEADLKQHPLKERRDYDQLFAEYQKKQQYKREYEEAKERAENAQKLVLEDELEKRLKVLRSLSFLSPNLRHKDGPPILTDKGKVACELFSGDTLVLAEMLFNPIPMFNEMNPDEIAALLSCFVFDEKAPDNWLKELPPRLAKYYFEMQEYIRKVAKLQQECGLELDAHKYLERFSPGMINAVFKWCKGKTLGQVLHKSEIYEGSMVRCFRRLHQLLGDVIESIHLDTANKHLEPKFVEARRMLKRGIPFAESIYT